MKAAVLHKLGTIPKYEDFPEPVIDSSKHELISIKAASIKQLDLLKASGRHYTSYPSLPAVVGVDGVGVLENGQRVYATGITGMIAEKALISKNSGVKIPAAMEDEIAVALPNALLGAGAALLYRAKIKKGDVVLVNGATGTTGMIAIQLARHFGASKIIATGRNENTLHRLKELGADETVSLAQEDETIVKQLTQSYHNAQVDVVLDYLWGHPAELILEAFKNIQTVKHTSFVTIGSMAGAIISLDSGLLRSKDIELIGSGIGSLTPENMADYLKNRLPSMFELAAEGKLQIEIEAVKLADVQTAWTKASTARKRIVVKVE